MFFSFIIVWKDSILIIENKIIGFIKAIQVRSFRSSNLYPTYEFTPCANLSGCEIFEELRVNCVNPNSIFDPRTRMKVAHFSFGCADLLMIFDQGEFSR